ncbi:4a-hydroxytetrahydrobiopterin dehydratase [Halopseudomonas nanhaiensis]|uniref:4a-hydroxytetrahydrobiopterin dehydratase n=1 Tax=Halopseudomonas nanhaiensis TaxID=2830842 RepID=UPI001CC09BAB|nr:4a-hydroxytetrahydrobiopterin dehydratase [Halopseudomonas nanhaiensis]UAW97383.1 4a-hydroxytetrahydrobiopterin dehydratase [Halopseudomonas nanhaiensis]
MALADDTLEQNALRPLDRDEIRTLLGELPGWQLVETEGVARLVRTYTFADFAGALGFTNRVGELAETHDHHPALLTEWGKVTVSWWTHSRGGVLRNDAIMAARTDRLHGPQP